LCPLSMATPAPNAANKVITTAIIATSLRRTAE
jgi:hypothetical protein